MKLTLIAAAFVASIFAASAAQACAPDVGCAGGFGIDEVKHHVVCKINDVHVIAKSDDDCKTAGGTVVDRGDAKK